MMITLEWNEPKKQMLQHVWCDRCGQHRILNSGRVPQTTLCKDCRGVLSKPEQATYAVAPADVKKAISRTEVGPLRFGSVSRNFRAAA